MKYAMVNIGHCFGGVAQLWCLESPLLHQQHLQIRAKNISHWFYGTFGDRSYQQALGQTEPRLWVVLMPNAPRPSNGCCFSLCFIRPITGLYILYNALHLYQGNVKLWWNSKISRWMSLVAFIPTYRIHALQKDLVPIFIFMVMLINNNHICYLTYDLY